MSLNDYEKAADLLRRHGSKSFFVGARAPELINKMEKRIGYAFPPSYRAFLLEFGAGSFGAAEIFGVIDEDVENSRVPDAIWYTLSQRRQTGMADDLLVIGETGDGSLYCLSLKKSPNEEAEVVEVNPGLDPPDQKVSVSAQDFGAFLLGLLRQETV